MDTWKFYDITHRDHVVCNPTSLSKLDEVIGLLDLPPDPRVLDVACGKGELLFRLAERVGRSGARFHGVGVDASPFVVAELRAAAPRRVPAADLEILEMDGADYRPRPASFDLACCLGASWIFDGHRGTLRALREAVRPGRSGARRGTVLAFRAGSRVPIVVGDATRPVRNPRGERGYGG